MKRVLLFLFFIALSSGLVRAQETIIEGQIVNLDHRPIAYAHVILLRNLTGTVSDSAGRFSMSLKYGDTLIISHIGYTTRVYSFNESSLLYDHRLEIVLLDKTYELKEVVITTFPKTWEEFKYAFENLKTDDEVQPADLHLDKEIMTGYNIPQGGFGVTMNGPITALYNMFSREAKSKRKLAILQENDRRTKTIGQRYNYDLIKRLTGITQQETIEKFMEFCHLSDEFILHSSDYDLYLAILECYREFCEKS